MSKLNENQKFLLDQMVKDEKKQNKLLYTAGPYWNYKTKKILYCLKKDGIQKFRGLNSGVGTSYTDNLVLDYRNELGFKGRIASIFTRLPYIRKIFDGQINYSASIMNSFVEQNAKNFASSDRVQSLLSKYYIYDSVEYDCILKFKYQEKEYSCHYLNLCDRLDIINKFSDYNKINTFFEIGGGFGAYIHLLLNNFKNIKKILYLDMIPNLFVGTQYLRHFYGDSVKDYNYLKKKEKITFSNNEDLEIFCIAPWQIENVHMSLDHFHNAGSFQEMSEDAVKNYAKYINKLSNKNTSISLFCYSFSGSDKTLDPVSFNKYFNNSLSVKKYPNLQDEKEISYYMLSQN